MARIQFTEKANLGKKVSESLPKQQRVAESLSKLEEVKAEEQVWKYQVQPVVLYKVAERKWGEAHDHLLQKNSEDDSESNRVPAVKFSPEAVPEALTQCEQETRRFKTPLVRGDNTDKDGDKQMWYFHGPAPPLFKVDNNFIPQVSAWSESVSME